MSEMMKTVRWSGARGARTLHVEAPGCIVNITKGLRDTEGREVTRVDIQCDNFAGEPRVSIPDYNGAKYLSFRVVREVQP